MKTPQGKLKICSQGYDYRRGGPCPICWPDRKTRLNAKWHGNNVLGINGPLAKR